MNELGFPHMFGGTAYAPFDYFGDNFRGTKGIMLDMYRHPDKLVKAMERVLPILAQSTITDAKRTGIPYIFMPLHKGLDGFMSLDQFKTFYWPTLRDLMMEFIKNDLVPCPYGKGDAIRAWRLSKTFLQERRSTILSEQTSSRPKRSWATGYAFEGMCLLHYW